MGYPLAAMTRRPEPQDPLPDPPQVAPVASHPAAALAPDARVAPRRHSRLRLWTFRAFEWVAASLGGRAWYARAVLGPGRFLLREEQVFVRDLPRALEGFTLAQLSDLHGGSFLARGGLRHVVDAVNARRPDVIVITGDFVTHAWHEALPLVDDCARLAAPHGVWAVFGNHDYKGREEGRIAAAFEAVGVRFLRNAGVRFERKSTGDRGDDHDDDGGDAHDAARLESDDAVHAGSRAVGLTGVEDLEEGRVIDPAAARRSLRPGDVEVLLCHNPTGGAALARPQCAVILSGHTHGTQIDAPFLRNLGPKHPGLRVQLGDTALIVSRGLGVVGVPLRWRSRAEVVIVTLRRAPHARPEDAT